MNISNHAQLRCQQRGISGSQMELILKYGTIKEKNGAYECFIPGHLVNEIRSQYKKVLQDLDKIFKSKKTLLLNDDTIITGYNKIKKGWK